MGGGNGWCSGGVGRGGAGLSWAGAGPVQLLPMFRLEDTAVAVACGATVVGGGWQLPPPLPCGGGTLLRLRLLTLLLE